ncbi:unnamed protein product [Clavelina lepadiformis]|uniref:Uncharacterized protein n=2 Tax=Clavelina lepadiformis TaxID=159417 RepID=A0ABP0FA89_CLALP
MDLSGSFCSHDFICALCENRTDLSAPCCCKDNDDDLFEITEARLLKRCNLTKGDRVCAAHFEKVKSGIIFGGGSSGCCAPFHVGPLPGQRLKPVPRAWRQHFDTSDISKRYSSQLLLCSSCYKITLDLLLNFDENSIDDVDSSDLVFTDRAKTSYTSPKSWLYTNSLNLTGSNSGSMWSLSSSSFTKKPSTDLMSMYSKYREKFSQPRAIPESIRRYLRSKHDLPTSGNTTPDRQDSFDFSDKENPKQEFIRQVSNASLQLQLSFSDTDSKEDGKKRKFFRLQSDKGSVALTDVEFNANHDEINSPTSLDSREVNLPVSVSDDNTDEISKADEHDIVVEVPTSVMISIADSKPTLLPENDHADAGVQSHLSSSDNFSVPEDSQIAFTPKSKQLNITVKSVHSPNPQKAPEEMVLFENTNLLSNVQLPELNQAAVELPEFCKTFVDSNHSNTEAAQTETELTVFVSQKSQTLPPSNDSASNVATQTHIVPTNLELDDDEYSNKFNLIQSRSVLSHHEINNKEPSSRLSNLSKSLSKEVVAFVLEYFRRAGKVQSSDCTLSNFSLDKQNPKIEALKTFANTTAQTIVNYVLQESSSQLLKSSSESHITAAETGKQLNNIAQFSCTLCEVILQDVEASVRRLNACDRCASEIFRKCVNIVNFAETEAKRIISNALEMLQETDVSVRRDKLAGGIVDNAISSALLAVKIVDNKTTVANVTGSFDRTERSQTTVQWLEPQKYFRSVVSIQVKDVAKENQSSAICAQKENGSRKNAIHEKYPKTQVSGEDQLTSKQFIECTIEELIPVTRSFSTNFLDSPTEPVGRTLMRSTSHDSFFTLVCKPMLDQEHDDNEFIVEPMKRTCSVPQEHVFGFFLPLIEKGSIVDKHPVENGVDKEYDSSNETDSTSTESLLSRSQFIVSFDDNEGFEPGATFVDHSYSSGSDMIDAFDDDKERDDSVAGEEEKVFGLHEAPLTELSGLLNGAADVGKLSLQVNFKDNVNHIDDVDESPEVLITAEDFDKSEISSFADSDLDKTKDESQSKPPSLSEDIEDNIKSTKPESEFKQRIEEEEETIPPQHELPMSSDLTRNLLKPNDHKANGEINIRTSAKENNFGEKVTAVEISKEQSSPELKIKNDDIAKPSTSGSRWSWFGTGDKREKFSLEREKSIYQSFNRSDSIQELVMGPQRSSIGSLQKAPVRQRRGLHLLRATSEAVMFCNRKSTLNTPKPEEDPEDEDVADVVCLAMEDVTPQVFCKRLFEDVNDDDEESCLKRNFIRAVTIFGVVSVFVYASWRIYNSF